MSALAVTLGLGALIIIAAHWPPPPDPPALHCGPTTCVVQR